MTSRCPPSLALVLLVTGLPRAGAQQVEVVFQVNDALVKDRPLEGVRVRVSASRGEAPVLAEGTTDAQGRVALGVPRSVVFVDYAAPGYVPLDDSETRIEVAGQVITTSLVRDLEGAPGVAGPRRIAIVLNWGSNEAHVRDVDSHLLHEPTGQHVFYGARQVAVGQREMNLDVDDTDWGGPETITLVDPTPGSYQHWVHAYAGAGRLDASEVVVRVIDGGSVVLEVRPPKGCDRLWTPFKALVVDGPEVRVVEWTEQEVAAGQMSTSSPAATATGTPQRSTSESGSTVCFACFLLLMVVAGVVFAAARAKQAPG